MTRRSGSNTVVDVYVGEEHDWTPAETAIWQVCAAVIRGDCKPGQARRAIEGKRTA